MTNTINGSTTSGSGEHDALLLSSQSPSTDDSSHRLTSHRAGASEVEQLAHKIQHRRQHRLLITFATRVKLLEDCRALAQRQGYDSPHKISRNDLIQLKQQYDDLTHDNRNWCQPLQKLLGLQTTDQYLRAALARALDHNITIRQSDWFWFHEWTFFYTRVASPWPWMRNETANAVVVVVLFFAATPLFFCSVLEDRNVCGDPSTGIQWLEGYYMASVTLSTVGYGDVTVEKDHIWAGTVYMIVSICVSIMAFGAAADDAFSPFENLYERYLGIDEDEIATEGNDVLPRKLWRIKVLKVGEIVTHFVMLNMIGVLASRWFHGNMSAIHSGAEWSWAESIYWSVQSTTTIGYGDMTMSPSMKAFQVVYLCLGTFFVGNTLGKLATLKQDMDSLTRQYAWEQREVSQEMIRADQGSASDSRVDQYEFVVASLLNLGKISPNDITPIMNKFRRLAQASGDQGYIELGNTNTGDPANTSSIAE